MPQNSTKGKSDSSEIQQTPTQEEWRWIFKIIKKKYLLENSKYFFQTPHNPNILICVFRVHKKQTLHNPYLVLVEGRLFVNTEKIKDIVRIV